MTQKNDSKKVQDPQGNDRLVDSLEDHYCIHGYSLDEYCVVCEEAELQEELE